MLEERGRREGEGGRGGGGGREGRGRKRIGTVGMQENNISMPFAFAK